MYTHNIGSVKLTKRQKAKLRRMAYKQGISQAEIVRRLIEEAKE